MVYKEALIATGLLAAASLVLLLTTFFHKMDMTRARIFLRFNYFRKAFTILCSFVLLTIGSHLAYIATLPGDQIRPPYGPGSPLFSVVVFMVYGSTIATAALLYVMFRPVK
jgi:hypothetical protein